MQQPGQAIIQIRDRLLAGLDASYNVRSGPLSDERDAEEEEEGDHGDDVIAVKALERERGRAGGRPGLVLAPWPCARVAEVLVGAGGT